MNTPTITEAQARERERKAGVDMALWAFRERERLAHEYYKSAGRIATASGLIDYVCAEAKRRYLPPVTPRVLKEENSIRWRLVDGDLQYNHPANPDHWQSAEDSRWAFTPERVQIWHSLYTQPTEESK